MANVYEALGSIPFSSLIELIKIPAAIPSVKLGFDEISMNISTAVIELDGIRVKMPTVKTRFDGKGGYEVNLGFPNTKLDGKKYSGGLVDTTITVPTIVWRFT